MRTSLRVPPRVAFAVYVVLAATAIVVHAHRTARLTMVNVGILIEQAPQAAFVLLGIGLALLIAAALASSTAARLIGLALALAAAGLGADNLLYRITTDRDALRVRTLVQRTVLGWKDIAKVENQGTQVAIVALDGRRLQLELATLTEQQRAAFHRTVARRIWESGPAPAR